MEKGLPVGLAEFLRFDDDEALEKAIAAIAALSNHDTSNQETKGRSWGDRQSGRNKDKDTTRDAFGLNRR